MAHNSKFLYFVICLFSDHLIKNKYRLVYNVLNNLVITSSGAPLAGHITITKNHNLKNNNNKQGDRDDAQEITAF